MKPGTLIRERRWRAGDGRRLDQPVDWLSGRRDRAVLLWLIVGLASSVDVAQWRPGPLLLGKAAAPDAKVTGILSDRLNPNTASCSSLARLPGIGPARAEAIVAFRSQMLTRREAGDCAFASGKDLQRVPLIGPKTVERMAPYLLFTEP